MNTAAKTRSSLLLCLLASVVLTAAEQVLTKDCGSQIGEVKSVRVSPCPTQPCSLNRGGFYTFEIEFRAKENADSATVQAFGELLGLPMKWGNLNPQVCGNGGIQCPIKAGQTYVYSQKIEVLKIYPKIELPVKWEIRAPNKKLLACVKFEKVKLL